MANKSHWLLFNLLFASLPCWPSARDIMIYSNQSSANSSHIIYVYLIYLSKRKFVFCCCICSWTNLEANLVSCHLEERVSPQQMERTCCQLCGIARCIWMMMFSSSVTVCFVQICSKLKRLAHLKLERRHEKKKLKVRLQSNWTETSNEI